MSHRKKFMGLGDPNITAAFQGICGINIRGHAGAKENVRRHASNGTVSNGYAYANHCVTGNNGVGNGSVKSLDLSNGCDSLLKAAGTNGHSKELRKRVEHPTNGSVVGDESFKNHKLHLENGYHGENGKVSRNGSVSKSNGTTHLSTNKNHSSQDNHVHANGHSNQIEAEEAPCPEYSIDNYLLYYIFSFGASLGNEVFYILFFSFALWNFDNFVGRKMLLFWCSVMYIGQAAKDVIRWPRPDSPPVIRLENRYELEYGMPSTHAMVAVAIPFGMLYFMLDRYEFNLVLGILFCVTWSILVSFSRLYLGMHSALDILAGLVFAFILMAMSVPFVDYWDMFLMTHPYAVPCLIGLGVTLCYLYPSLDKWSTARGDTTLSVAVFSGIYAGLWCTRQYTNDIVPLADTPPFVLQLANATGFWVTLQRQAIGVIVIVVLLTTLKLVVLRIVCKVLGFDPKDPDSKKHLVIELPYKYVSYFVTSWTASYLMPLLFLHLNIHRQSFYTEIFIDSRPGF